MLNVWIVYVTTAKFILVFRYLVRRAEKNLIGGKHFIFHYRLCFETFSAVMQ